MACPIPIMGLNTRPALWWGLLWLALAGAAGAQANGSPARVLVERAVAQQDLHPQQSLRDAQAALDQLRTTPDPDLEIQARLILCAFRYDTDLAAARLQADAAQALLPRTHEHGLRAGVLLCQGSIQEAQGDTATALGLYSQAVEAATQARDDDRQAAALYARGYLLGVQGEYAAALVDLRRAQSVYEGLHNTYQALAVLDSIASLYVRMGDGEGALPLYQQVLAFERQQGMLSEQAINLLNIGRADEVISEWPEARAAYAEGLALARREGLPRWEAYGLRGLAVVANAQNQPQRALELLRQARALQQQVTDARLAAQIDLQEGRALRALGRLRDSLLALERARKVFQSADSAAELAATCAELAQVHAALDDWRTAYERAVDVERIQQSLFKNQLAQRFAMLKVEYDTAAREEENRALQTANESARRELEQAGRVRLLQGIVIVLGAVLAAVLAWLMIRSHGHARRMGALAMTDELTGVPNRRAVLARLDQLLHGLERAPCCILVMDIDHFKFINDRYGHGAGDEVLKLIAGTVQRMVREPGFFGRLGGEEFLAVLPVGDLEQARRLSEAVRGNVGALNVGRLLTGHPGLTTSIGVTASVPGDTTSSILGRADQALYAAKGGGRNCVRVEPATAAVGGNSGQVGSAGG